MPTDKSGGLPLSRERTFGRFVENPGRRTMIAHIRQPKKPEAATPIVRTRQMVAETLLPHGPARAGRRAAVRKVLLFGGLVLLAVMAGLAYWVWR